MEKVDYSLFNKVILFTIDLYIDRIRAEGVVIPKSLERLKLVMINYKVNNKFSMKERDLVLGFAKEKELQDIVQTHISHIVFILTIVKLWVEMVPKKDRPKFNMSDKKLIKGKAEYTIEMLKLKQVNEDSYKEKKEIIQKSVETAEKFMDYHLQKLVIKEEA